MFDHKSGPIYLIECFPYVTVLKRGILKSEFLKLYVVVAALLKNKSWMYGGTGLFLTLNINIAMSCNILLYNEGRFALVSNCS